LALALEAYDRIRESIMLMILLTMGLNSVFFFYQPFNPRIISKMIKSAFQIPHHVAIRIFVYAQPRPKLSLNIGAGGDGFPPREEKG